MRCIHTIVDRQNWPHTGSQCNAHAIKGSKFCSAHRPRDVKEGDIRELLKARIKAYGGEQRAVAWLGRKNAPDVLALFPEGTGRQEMFRYPGGHVFIETKRPGKDATEAQAREHERMRAAGCDVRVITNEQELDAWLPPL